MKYQLGKKQNKRRDWVVIGLLYGMIFFMATTAYYWLACYTGSN